MRVHSLHIYPLKAGYAIDLNEAAVEPRGLAHDRRWMLVDANNRLISQREHAKMALATAIVTPSGLGLSAPGLPDIIVTPPNQSTTPLTAIMHKKELLGRAADETANAWFSNFLGIPCTLIYQGDLLRERPEVNVVSSFADSMPLLITTTASLADLNHRMGKDLPMNRFRPNIVIDCDEPWAEDKWKHLRIGDVEIEMIKACDRCVVTTIDQQTAEKTGPEPLATLKTFRLVKTATSVGVMFGVRATSRTTGIVRIGNNITIL